MQMARSTYYFELSKADQVAVRNHCLADEIKDIFSQHKGRYGVRRVYQELIQHDSSYAKMDYRCISVRFFVGEVLSLSYTRHEHKRNHFL